MVFKQSLLSNKHFPKKFLTILFFASFVINSGCGKRKPPLPPVEKVYQQIEISGFQRGNQVNLSWTMPARNTLLPGSTLNVNRIDVYRLAEPVNASVALTEEEFSSQSTLIATLPVKRDDFGLKKFSYADELQFAGQNVRLRYAVRLVNSSGQKAAFSNYLLIEPTAKISQPPGRLSLETQEAAVILRWSMPAANVDESKPANIIGYNIYRSESENQPANLLNKTPVNQLSFSDAAFKFGTRYFYFVRAVSLGSDSEPVESLASNIVETTPKDVYPPAEPTALTIAAAPRNISIFFAANTESDFAGYRVFRSTDKNQPLSEWQSLNAGLLTANTIQDTAVESGKTYYYFIVAVDKNGNVSRPSAIVSETLP